MEHWYFDLTMIPSFHKLSNSSLISLLLLNTVVCDACSIIKQITKSQGWDKMPLLNLQQVYHLHFGDWSERKFLIFKNLMDSFHSWICRGGKATGKGANSSPVSKKASLVRRGEDQRSSSAKRRDSSPPARKAPPPASKAGQQSTRRRSLTPTGRSSSGHRRRSQTPSHSSGSKNKPAASARSSLGTKQPGNTTLWPSR